VQTEMDNYRSVLLGVGAGFQGVIDRGPAASGSIDAIFRSAQASKDAFMGNVTTVDTLLRHLESIPKTFSTSWNIKATVDFLGFQITTAERRALQGFQHGGFVPPGVVMPAILHGGSRGEAVIPLDRVSRAGGGGGPVTIQVNSRFPPDRRLLRAEVMSLIPEIERALRLR